MVLHLEVKAENSLENDISYECARAINTVFNYEKNKGEQLDSLSSMVFNCNVVDNEITITSFPNDYRVRGGGKAYVVDRTSFKVVRFYFER